MPKALACVLILIFAPAIAIYGSDYIILSCGIDKGREFYWFPQMGGTNALLRTGVMTQSLSHVEESLAGMPPDMSVRLRLPVQCWGINMTASGLSKVLSMVNRLRIPRILLSDSLRGFDAAVIIDTASHEAPDVDNAGFSVAGRLWRFDQWHRCLDDLAATNRVTQADLPISVVVQGNTPLFLLTRSVCQVYSAGFTNVLIRCSDGVWPAALKVSRTYDGTDRGGTLHVAHMLDMEGGKDVPQNSSEAGEWYNRGARMYGKVNRSTN